MQMATAFPNTEPFPRLNLGISYQIAFLVLFPIGILCFFLALFAFSDRFAPVVAVCITEQFECHTSRDFDSDLLTSAFEKKTINSL